LGKDEDNLEEFRWMLKTHTGEEREEIYYD
jgi:hypothetical protein